MNQKVDNAIGGFMGDASIRKDEGSLCRHGSALNTSLTQANEQRKAFWSAREIELFNLRLKDVTSFLPHQIDVLTKISERADELDADTLEIKTSQLFDILNILSFLNNWKEQIAALSTQAEMLKACKEALWVAHENSKLHNGEKYNVTIQTGEVLKKLQSKGY